jgi:hypothetical protein
LLLFPYDGDEFNLLLSVDCLDFPFAGGLSFLFPLFSVSSFRWVNSNESLCEIKLSLALTSESDEAIIEIKRHIMMKVEDFASQGRLILILSDLIVRYFIDESGALLLTRFLLVSLPGSF